MLNIQFFHLPKSISFRVDIWICIGHEYSSIISFFYATRIKFRRKLRFYSTFEFLSRIPLWTIYRRYIITYWMQMKWQKIVNNMKVTVQLEFAKSIFNFEKKNLAIGGKHILRFIFPSINSQTTIEIQSVFPKYYILFQQPSTS